MAAIAVDFLNRPCVAHVFLDEDEGCYYVMVYHGEDHDEGYSARYVWVYLASDDGERRYRVEVRNAGRDCDGRHSADDSFFVTPLRKAKRWYMSRNWQRNRPEGKFGVRRWKATKVDSRVFDEFAQAAGY